MGGTPVLVGSARGDYSVLGVGDRELSDIAPKMRTTPAGRFVARIGPSLGLGKVLWIDFPGAIAMHRVLTNKPKEKRAERLRSPSPTDNRITYGCINISPTFYDGVVSPLFTGAGGVVYILPETRPLAATFPAFRAQVFRAPKRQVRRVRITRAARSKSARRSCRFAQAIRHSLALRTGSECCAFAHLLATSLWMALTT